MLSAAVFSSLSYLVPTSSKVCYAEACLYTWKGGSDWGCQDVFLFLSLLSLSPSTVVVLPEEMNVFFLPYLSNEATLSFPLYFASYAGVEDLAYVFISQDATRARGLTSTHTGSEARQTSHAAYLY